MHSRQTHSVAAVVLVGALVYVSGGRRARLAMAAAIAYGSHIVLDWLGTDTSVPIGIMALWPLTGGFYESDLHWFMAISRHFRQPGFLSHNLRAVLWEILLLVPAAVGMAAYRFRKRAG